MVVSIAKSEILTRQQAGGDPEARSPYLKAFFEIVYREAHAGAPTAGADGAPPRSGEDSSVIRGGSARPFGGWRRPGDERRTAKRLHRLLVN